MEFGISTPALLFPALSLLLLVYTNRFLATAHLARMLHETDKNHIERDEQIRNLKYRLDLTKWMQFFGVMSILLCTFAMFGLFLGYLDISKKVFGLSMLVMSISLVIYLLEISVSTKALNLELCDAIDKHK